MLLLYLVLLPVLYALLSLYNTALLHVDLKRSADVQIYSVYMHLRHKLQQLQPKLVNGFKSNQQLADDRAKAKACSQLSSQIARLCAHVKAIWADSPDQGMLQMGLPVLRYHFTFVCDC